MKTKAPTTSTLNLSDIEAVASRAPVTCIRRRDQGASRTRSAQRRRGTEIGSRVAPEVQVQLNLSCISYNKISQVMSWNRVQNG